MGQKVILTPRAYDALYDAGLLVVDSIDKWGTKISGVEIEEEVYTGRVICELIEGEEVRIEK